MKNSIFISLVLCLMMVPQIGFSQTVTNVANFTGQQVTGVSVSDNGRLFANFPKWRAGVKYDVVEVKGQNNVSPFPNESWNSWVLGDDLTDEKFISVQSVLAHDGKLYVLDTANPMFKGVLSSPRLFVFRLEDAALLNTYTFPEGVYKPNSYFNDLRVNLDRNEVYITDSGQAGLVILDITSGQSQRVLDDSPYTKAETDHLLITGKRWGGKPVHSDGIALDSKNDILYIHALTGYTLYGFHLDDLKTADIKPSITLKTAAPDGMIIDQNSFLYFGDLENQKIMYIDLNSKVTHTLAEGEHIAWPDTFSISGCNLYYTNSRIHESHQDIEKIEYMIEKIQLPHCVK